MITFRDLKEYIQNGYANGNLQIYSNKRQVNVINKDDLALCSIVFNDSDEVLIFTCDKPGYANYDSANKFLLDDSIIIALQLNENAIKASQILSNIA